VERSEQRLWKLLSDWIGRDLSVEKVSGNYVCVLVWYNGTRAFYGRLFACLYRSPCLSVFLPSLYLYFCLSVSFSPTHHIINTATSLHRTPAHKYFPRLCCPVKHRLSDYEQTPCKQRLNNQPSQQLTGVAVTTYCR